MRRLIVYVLLFTLFVGFLTVVKTRSSSNLIPQKQIKEIKIDENKLFNLVNTWRKSVNLTEYIKDDRLCEIAKDRADDEFDHQGFIDKYSNNPNYPKIAMQENLSTAYDEFGRAFNNNQIFYGWLSSAPHRETLEKPYKYSCIVCDEQCVEIFGNYL